MRQSERSRWICYLNNISFFALSRFDWVTLTHKYHALFAVLCLMYLCCKCYISYAKSDYRVQSEVVVITLKFLQ